MRLLYLFVETEINGVGRIRARLIRFMEVSLPIQSLEEIQKGSNFRRYDGEDPQQKSSDEGESSKRNHPQFIDFNSSEEEKGRRLLAKESRRKEGRRVTV